MVAIDGVRSYIYVRADNMSQAFDCALMRTNARNPARNPQSYVEVLTAQELHEPVECLHSAGRGIPNSYRRSARRLLTTQLLGSLTPPPAGRYARGDALAEIIFSGQVIPRIAVN